MPASKDSIWFILVRTQFASNLGTSVRAMKNMGFEKLALIEPECEVGVEARARAMKGDYVLDRARFFPSLEDAQREIGVLVGTTGRFEEGSGRSASCRRFAQQVLPRLVSVPLGIVFGPEDNGLRRSELRLCQYLLSIPSGSDYPVMNLSQAVAVLAYELHLAFSKDERPVDAPLPSAEEVQGLLRLIENRLLGCELPDGISTTRLMKRIRKLTSRTPLESEDLNMLQHLLRSGHR